MGLPKDSGLLLHSKHEPGPDNSITDVVGVRVGSVTLQQGAINTGVTAILPHGGNLFRDKVLAGSSVINGFGKSMGLIQVEELGTIETPILMTNTLSIGTAQTALCKYMLEQNPDIGVETGTVNCMVTECNDGRLNDIRGLHVTEDHVRQALAQAAGPEGTTVAEGAVGAGTGMVCLGLKGGIGTASRTFQMDDTPYTIGALVLSNFGAAGNLVIGGVHYDTKLAKTYLEEQEPRDRGSIVMVLATDVPLSERQLKRVSRRAMISLGRVGSYSGNGSGDIAITFTTANRLHHYSQRDVLEIGLVYDENIDRVFEAAVEAVEEAIISSLWHAQTTTGVRGNTYMGLQDFLARQQ